MKANNVSQVVLYSASTAKLVATYEYLRSQGISKGDLCLICFGQSQYARQSELRKAITARFVLCFSYCEGYRFSRYAVEINLD